MKNIYKFMIVFGVIGLLVAAKVISEGTRNPPPPPPPPPPKVVPEFPAKAKWFNSEPLHMADMKGTKVVLVQFWRFGCPHCAQSAPHISRLYRAFEDKGLVVVGVHSPSVGNEAEKDPRQVEKVIKQWGIDYPVVLDNDGELWKAYGARSYPTFYLIDKAGQVERTLESDTMEAMTALADGIQKLCNDQETPPPQATQ